VRRAAAILAASALAGLALADPLPAQVCNGQPSLDGSLASVAGSVASYSFATARGGSVTVGRRIFGTIGAAHTYDAELDASTLDIGGSVGYERAVARDGGLRVCPVVYFAAVFGPNELLLHDRTYRRIDAGAGVRVGGVASRTPNVSLIPSAGLAVHRSKRTVTFYSPFRPPESSVRSGNYVLLTVDAGVVLRELVTIRPGISIPFGFAPDHHNGALVYPFGRTDRELSFGIAAVLRVPMPGR
jgi:hypothetical protein